MFCVHPKFFTTNQTIGHFNVLHKHIKAASLVAAISEDGVFCTYFEDIFGYQFLRYTRLYVTTNKVRNSTMQNILLEWRVVYEFFMTYLLQIVFQSFSPTHHFFQNYTITICYLTYKSIILFKCKNQAENAIITKKLIDT